MTPLGIDFQFQVGHNHIYMVNEEWKDIPGFEGRYQISNLGRVKSLPRYVKNGTGYRSVRGGIRKHSRNGPREYPSINLKDKSFTIHRLLGELWIPNPTGLPEVLHKDDDPNNYNLDNLYWGTSSQNSNDTVKNGNHHYAKRDLCDNGHEFTEQNTYVRSDGGRRCRACERIRKGKVIE